MNWLQRLFQRQHLENDLARELQYHLERRIADLIADGIEPPEAARQARLEFGSPDAIKEACRDARGTRWLEDLINDYRYSLRTLRRSPAFTTVAIFSLALAIGANTAAFSLIDAMLLKPLPVRDPQQLRILNFVSTGREPLHAIFGSTIFDDTKRAIASPFSYDAFRTFQTQPHEFESLLGFTESSVVVRTGDWSDTASAQFVSGNYFEELGIQAAQGRALTRADDTLSAPPVAVITGHFWRRLGSPSNVVGQTIYVNQLPATIAGVLPPAFQGLVGGRAQDVFFSLSTSSQLKSSAYNMADPYEWFVQIFGRLRPGASESAAAISLREVLARQIETYAPGKPAPEIVIKPGAHGVNDYFPRFTLPSIWTLSAASVLVLTICCVNLANLLLGRGASRSHETAVRLSLGASRWRVMRHLLTESVLLAFAGGVLGFLLAQPLLTLALRYLGGEDGLSLDARLDWRALLFTSIVCLGATLLFGTMPAWKITRVDLAPALKDQSGGRVSARNSLSRALVIVQVALSMIMLTGAAMLTRTFQNLSGTDVGFKTDHLLLFQTYPARIGYEGANVVPLYSRIRESLEALPGVASVALSHLNPLGGGSWIGDVYVPAVAGNKNAHTLTWLVVGSDSYLKTMGIPLLAGRTLNSGDTTASERVAVVNEAFAKLNMPGVDPVGQIFYDASGPNPKTPPIRIVGVVRDAAYSDIRDEIGPSAYLSYMQKPNWAEGMTFLIRTSVNPASLAGPVRAAVAAIDRNLPIIGMRTQDEEIAISLNRERLLAWLSSGFGLLAAILAAIGIYGVMAYAVSRRTQEFGIRLALGATRAHVQWITLRASVWMIGIGLGIGAISALLLTKYLASILYKVTPQDAFSFTAAAVLMIAAGLLAAWIPARRAAYTNPLQALRQE